MRFFPALVFLLVPAFAQTCAPRPVLRPVDVVAGSLDENNCRLSDGSSFAEYSLTLPTRGEIQLEAESSNLAVRLALRDARGHAVALGTSVRQAVERGSYVVAVAAATGAQSGQFRVTSAFTPEPRTLCRGFALIGLNQVVTGRLNEASCHLPDKTAFDGYSLRTFGSGTLDISMQSDEVSPYLIVRGENGHALAAGEKQISVSVDGDQSYTIIAASADSGTGAYRLALAFTPADDETCRPLRSFKVPGTHQGSISPDSCTFRVAGADAPSFYNYYEIQVTEAGVADIRLSTAAFAPYLLLLDESGATVQWDAGSGGSSLAVLHEPLQPGKYAVMAFSLSTAGDYTFEYHFRPGLPEICPARSADAGKTATGRLSEASCRTQEGIADVYLIDVPAAGTLDLAMNSTEFIPLLTLRDARDNRIVTDDNYGNSINSRIIADLPAGSYSVVAGTGGAPGGYSFTYQITPHNLAPCTAQKASPNSAYVGVFNATSCRGPNGQPIDYYEITTPADGTVAAVMQSPVLDSFLSLQTADGAVLRWDNDSFGFPDAIVAQFLPGRTYRLAARAADAIATGYYRLDLVYLPGDRPAGCTPMQSVSTGDVISGTLSVAACQYVDDTFADIYQLDLRDTTALDVRLESQEFDAYVEVLDAKGNVLAEDDNSAGGSNASLTASLDPGTYYIVAKPFADFSSLGKYTLRVGQAE